MSAHDWPEFGKHPNPCYTENGNGDRYAIRLSREAYNYAKVRIDACAGIANELLEAGAAPIHLKAEIYRRERDALQQRCEELVAEKLVLEDKLKMYKAFYDAN